MYSEHGLDAVMRPVSGLVCQSLIVSSYCRPGSAHAQAASLILRNRSRASTVSMTSPVPRAAQAEVGAVLDRTHELVADADRVVGVLVLDGGDVGAAEVHVEAGVAQGADLVLLARLGLTNSSMSGWSTSRTTILAARRVAPPDLMVPADASAPRMKETGPDAVPPEERSSLEERMRERLRPAPEPPLKMKPSSLYQLRIESIESSTERMKQAETCCGDGVPTLNQTGELKEKYWLTSSQVSSCSKTSASTSAGEVAVVDAGLGVGLHDPVDELLEAPLAYVGADGAAEVLGGDDGGGVDRPEVGELDAALLEDGLAGLPVLLDDVATLPRDGVVGVGALGAEDALQRQALALRALAPVLTVSVMPSPRGGGWFNIASRLAGAW